jgi:hypothetical protein
MASPYEIIVLTHDTYHQITFKVDPTKTANFEEQLRFFGGDSDYEDRLRKNEGCVKTAFLKLLASVILPMTYNWYTSTIIKEFKESVEGFYPLEIEYGVELLDTDTLRFDEDDFFVEVKAE